MYFICKNSRDKVQKVRTFFVFGMDFSIPLHRDKKHLA